MIFQVVRWLALLCITLLVNGCMIPLPTHRTSRAPTTVAHRNDAAGHRTHSIIEKRKVLHGRWLFDHHGHFLKEFEITSFRSYGLSNHLEHIWSELRFLEHRSEEPWKIVPVRGSKSWLAHRSLDWSPSGSTEAVIVFNDLGESHLQKMRYVKGFAVLNGGQEISVQTVDGTQVYRVLDNQIKPAGRDNELR